MRVFVAGGTGVLGRRLVPQLVARGHQVTATTSSPSKVGLLEQLGADAVVMDGLDAASVGEAVAEARAGRVVCGAFYGHPGVFAEVPHRAIAQARAEGLAAVMEPGISAEDCLYADLGFDPGSVGCQHHEASQFMFYRRIIDPSAWLVLWQVGIAGDRSLARKATGPAHRQLLLELLAASYPLDHEVIAYEAATLPFAAARVERMPLRGLVEAQLSLQTTLAIPPALPLERNDQVLGRLAALEASNP